MSCTFFTALYIWILCDTQYWIYYFIVCILFIWLCDQEKNIVNHTILLTNRGYYLDRINHIIHHIH